WNLQPIPTPHSQWPWNPERNNSSEGFREFLDQATTNIKVRLSRCYCPDHIRTILIVRLESGNLLARSALEIVIVREIGTNGLGNPTTGIGNAARAHRSNY